MHHVYRNSMDHGSGLAWLMANRVESDLSDITLHVTSIDFHWLCFSAEWHQYHRFELLMKRLCASGWAVTELTLMLAIFMLLATEVSILSDSNGGMTTADLWSTCTHRICKMFINTFSSSAHCGALFAIVWCYLGSALVHFLLRATWEDQCHSRDSIDMKLESGYGWCRLA